MDRTCDRLDQRSWEMWKHRSIAKASGWMQGQRPSNRAEREWSRDLDGPAV